MARNIQCADAVDFDDFDTTNLMGVEFAPKMANSMASSLSALNILSTKTFLKTRPDFF